MSEPPGHCTRRFSKENSPLCSQERAVVFLAGHAAFAAAQLRGVLPLLQRFDYRHGVVTHEVEIGTSFPVRVAERPGIETVNDLGARFL